MRESLSKRQRAVLSWLLQGFSDKEIGLALGINSRAVQKYLQGVYRRIGVGTRAEAIVWTLRRSRNVVFGADPVRERPMAEEVGRRPCFEGQAEYKA